MLDAWKHKSENTALIKRMIKSGSFTLISPDCIFKHKHSNSLGTNAVRLLMGEAKGTMEAAVEMLKPSACTSKPNTRRLRVKTAVDVVSDKAAVGRAGSSAGSPRGQASAPTGS